MNRIKVLIVDDSATMRSLIGAVLRRDAEIEIVGTAGDPLEARAKIKELEPDVLTLDIEMPNMNGLEFLEKIMRLRPMPVIMVSTLTQKGADATLEALEIGAFDCIGKPGPDADVVTAFGELAWSVGDEMRKLITFNELNLIGQWPMKGRFDVIFCRNVVIYFEEETQAKVWARFKPLLNPEGRLYIGHSERLNGPAAAAFATDGLTTYKFAHPESVGGARP